jgi:hypothetical protein
MRESQSKRRHRNTNPLPTGICVGKLCKGIPGSAPKEKAPSRTETGSASPQSQYPNNPAGESSSKRTAEQTGAPPANSGGEQCDWQQAVRDVDAGDSYFSDKSYTPALNRYRLASEEKPNDPAIHLRLARAYEKLNQKDKAVVSYRAVIELSDPESPRTKEAQAALQRLSATAKK